MSPNRPKKSEIDTPTPQIGSRASNATTPSALSDRPVAPLVLLLLIAGAAALVRIFWDLPNVISASSVRFPSTDPWVHVRQVDYLVRNFPTALAFDPFGAYPKGQGVAVAPLLDYLTAVLAWLLGPIIPHPEPVHVICAFLPPLLASLTTVALYWIARSWFNRGVALFAALLFAITPGVHYTSSVLGFLDHHVLEVLLSTLTLGALAQAFRSAETLAHHAPSRFGSNRQMRSLTRSLLFGLLLALYLLTWIGGSFLVLIVAAWTVCQAVAEHFKRRPTLPVSTAVVPGIVLSLLIVLPFRNSYPMAGHQILTLCGSFLVALALPAASNLITRLELPRYCFALFVAAVATGGTLTLYNANPYMFDRVLAGLGPAGAHTAAKTVGEVRSLFWSEQGPTLAPAWQLFATGYPLALIGLVILVWRVLRHGRGHDVLLLVWSGAVLLAMMGQLRFGYYAAVNVSILAAFACYKAIENAAWIPQWLRTAAPSYESDIPSEDRAGAARPAHMQAEQPEAPRWSAAIMLVWLGAIAVVPPAYALGRVAGSFTGPSDAWVEALLWMRHNTPEPLGDADAYFAVPDRFDETGAFVYPQSAYGVMCWWDYGYWVTGIARRIPNANPTQRGAREAAHFYLTSNEAEAIEMLQSMGTRYVIVDGALPMLPGEGTPTPTGMFEALARWAEQPVGRYYQTVYQANAAEQLEPVTLFFPDYFQAMSVRLLLYGASGAKPSGSFEVVRLQEVKVRPARTATRIESTRYFETYEEASDFVSQPGNENTRLVSRDPTRTCVPLEPPEQLRGVYDAPRSATEPKPTKESVRIFRIDPDQSPTHDR